MASTVAADRFLILFDLDGNELYQVVEFAGREALNEPFEFRLRLRRPIAVGGPVASLIGKGVEVRFQLPNNKTRKIRGVVRDFVRKRSDAKYHRVECVLVPMVWPAAMNRRCRIFQDKTAREILEAILSSYVVEYRFPKSDYIRRNTCVQYMESDFDFAQRLMEEEGIHYYFDHARNSQLVVGNESISNPMLADPSRLKFNEARGQFSDGGRIFWLEAGEQMTVPHLRMFDQCFEKSNAGILAEATVFPGKTGRGGKWDEKWGEYVDLVGGVAHHFDPYGPNREDRAQLLDGVGAAVKNAANLRAECFAAQFARTSADSDYLHVAPGFRFELTDADPDDNGAYLIVGVDHHYQMNDAEQWQIGNRMDCLRADVPFRPIRRTPKPSIRGTQSAIVTGYKDATIWTDRYGRVQVRFFWEDGDEHSCWLRVAQSWAGDGMGSLMTPRVGHEVLVGFLYGDPDQPVVMKSLYNANNLPAYNPAVEPGTSGFYSRTNKAGAKLTDSSHLLFVDAAGKEQLHLHAEKHAHISAEYSMVQTVGWGSGDTGALNYLSGSTQATAGNVWSDVKSSIFGGGKWQAGYVSKVKGVERHSVWGHEIDVTLGTSHDFVVGGWAQGKVGLGVSLDIGFRTDVMIGFHVNLHVAPHYVFGVGNRFDIATGQRFIKTWGDMSRVVGGSYLEKIGGSKTVMMGANMPDRLIRDASGTSQFYDVGGCHIQARGPVVGGPDAAAISATQDALEKAAFTKKLMAMDEYHQKAALNMLPRHYHLTEEPDAAIEQLGPKLAALQKRYGSQIIDSFGGITIGTVGDKATLWLYAFDIEFVCDRFNIYAPESIFYDGKIAKKMGFEAMNEFGKSENAAHVFPMIEKMPLIDAKLKATEGASLGNAAVAVPGMLIAGAALAGGIIAAADHDPTQWGL